MYTQCPDCATVFRVTADALRAAHGDVRCGVCSTTFNALENLSEQSFKVAATAFEAPDPSDSMTVEELPGGENIELSEESDPAAGIDRTDEYPVIVLDERDEPVESIVLAAEPPETSHTAPRILIPDEMRKRLAEEAAARSSFTQEFEPADGSEPRRRWPWAVAAGGLLLLLGAQVVHGHRDQWIQHPGVGPVIAETYALLGLSLTVPTDLAAYELRQWGAASDPNEADRLLLRASIVNRAAFAQPLPLLRLALQDRFGATLGVRDIGPGDYLPGAGAPGLLGPGERADAEIRIVDPGREAVGFEMDICVPAGDGVRCANQVTAATR